MTSDRLGATTCQPALAIGVAAAGLLFIALCFAPPSVSDFPVRHDRRSIVEVLEPGADAADLETEFVRPIEAALRRLASVRHVSSLTGEGRSAIEVELRQGPDEIATRDAVRAAVEQATRDLLPPPDVRVRTIDRAASPLVTYAVAWRGRTPGEIAAVVDGDVVPAIRRVAGLGEIEQFGGATRQTLVSLRAERLEALSVTAAEVGRQWRTALAASPGPSSATGVEEAGAVVIRLPGGGSVRLDDLATVRDIDVPASSFARLDGEPVVGLDIYADDTRGDVAVAEDVAAVVAKIGAAYPEIVLTRIVSRGDTAALRLLLVCAGLAAMAGAAVLIFAVVLRDWRAGVWAAVAIVVPLAASGLLMAIFSMPLDVASLAGFIVAAGIVAGDAVDAATDRTATRSSLAGAVAAVGALPFCLIDDPLLGRCPCEFSLALVFAAASAWLTRRVLLPAIHVASFALPNDGAGDLSLDLVTVLRWNLRHCRAMVASGILGLTLAVAGTRWLPPDPGFPEDRSRFGLAFSPSASMAAMDDVIADAASKRKGRPDVTGRYAVGMESRGRTELWAIPPGAAILPDLDVVPDMRAWKLDQFSRRDIEIEVIGREAAAVDQVVDRLADQMRDLPMLDRVATSTTAAHAAVRIRADRARVAQFGVDPSAVEETIRMATGGVFLPSRSSSSTFGAPSPLGMRLGLQTVDWIGLLRIPGPAGAMVPLGSVAQIGVGPIAGPILSLDGEVEATLGADVGPAESRAAAQAAVAALPGMADLPPGVRVHAAGDPERVNGVLGGLRRAAGTSVVLVGLVLLVGFRRLIPTVFTLSILPVPIAGAVLALMAARLPFGTASLPGLGLAIGFMLQQTIAFGLLAARAMEHDTSVEAVLIEASRRRVLPLLLTMSSIVAGLLPLSLAPEVSALTPAAVAAFGGLMAATLAGIFGCPLVFQICHDISALLRLGLVRSGHADDPVRVHR